MPTVDMFESDGQILPVDAPDVLPEASEMSQDSMELEKQVLWSKAAGMTLADLYGFLDQHFGDQATGQITDTITPLVIAISLGCGESAVKIEQPLVGVQIVDGKVRLIAKATADVT